MSWSAPDQTWPAYASGAADGADLDVRVHVWRVRLDGPSTQAGASLSADERARADRFARPADRRRFVRARETLRTLLADILRAGDTPLRLGYGPRGKPFLRDAPGLHFNVSHSAEAALIVVSRTGEVGVDIERQRPLDDLDGLGRLVFDAAELAALRDGPAEHRLALFYRFWTRKEALLKAMGLGLPALDQRGPAALARAGAAWTVADLPAPEGFAAALAQPRHTPSPRLWSWPDGGPAGGRAASPIARPAAPAPCGVGR